MACTEKFYLKSVLPELVSSCQISFIALTLRLEFASDECPLQTWLPSSLIHTHTPSLPHGYSLPLSLFLSLTHTHRFPLFNDYPWQPTSFLSPSPVHAIHSKIPASVFWMRNLFPFCLGTIAAAGNLRMGVCHLKRGKNLAPVYV